MIVTVKYLKETEKWDLPGDDESIFTFIDSIHLIESFNIIFDTLLFGQDIDVLNSVVDLCTNKNYKLEIPVDGIWADRFRNDVRLSSFSKSIYSKESIIRDIESGDIVQFNGKTYLLLSTGFVLLEEKVRSVYLKRQIGDLHNHNIILKGPTIDGEYQYYGEISADGDIYDDNFTYKKIFRIDEIVGKELFCTSYIFGEKELEKEYDMRVQFLLGDFINNFGNYKIDVKEDNTGLYVTKKIVINDIPLTKKIRLTELSKPFK